MYEELDHIARLKFNKEMEAISERTRGIVREAQNDYAAKTGGSGMRSGQHDASVGRIQIEGAEELGRFLFQTWIDLVKQQTGQISRKDIAFVVGKIEDFARTRKGHLHQAFKSQRMGAVVNLLAQEGELQMSALVSNARRDLEIMVRENEVLPKRADLKREHHMEPMPKKRFSTGRRVLVGNQSRPGTVVSVQDRPGELGEFAHQIRLDQDGQTKAVLGCDLQAFPELDEDLRQRNQPTVHWHIENSQIANLNLGTQIGTINAAIQSISEQDVSKQELAEALKQLTEAAVSEKSLCHAPLAGRRGRVFSCRADGNLRPHD
jgi:hypothetical protein